MVGKLGLRNVERIGSKRQLGHCVMQLVLSMLVLLVQSKLMLLVQSMLVLSMLVLNNVGQHGMVLELLMEHS